MNNKKNLKKDTLSKAGGFLKNESNEWDKDNQAWWDWYVTLADNSNSNSEDTLLELPEPPKKKLPSKIELKQELARPYNTTNKDITTFQKNGFIKLKNDNALVKESGCGRTPWHYDDHHFPLATNDVITAWIPAQAIPVEMGPLTFAKPLEVYKLVKDIKFNEFDTSYDKKINDIFKTKQVSIVEEPFELGEVSFHHNLSFHTASENKTTQSRIVLANTYFADGARVVNNPTMISGDWKKFIPETNPGEIVSSNLNPICWPVKN